MPTPGSSGRTFGWLDTARIAEALNEAHPKIDPLGVRFTDLRRMVEALTGFSAVPGHPVNERILETIQAQWHDERDDSPAED